MPEEKSKRTFTAPAMANPAARLEPIRPARSGQAGAPPYARMTPQQRKALVQRLITFIKNF